MRFSPRFLPIYAVLVLVTLVLLSQVGWASAPNAKAYVENLSTEVISLIKSKASDKEKEQKLSSIFENSVDTEWMGRFVMGQNFRKMTDDQKKRYFGLYKQYLVQSYVPRFKEYTGEKIKINGLKENGEEYFVQTEIVHPNGEPSTLVDYRLRKEGDEYKIIDIIGEGISLITTQRSDFGGIITQQGVDKFLEKLQAKVENYKKA
jgi:phospholipid transport system substrate-binding protein